MVRKRGAQRRCDTLTLSFAPFFGVVANNAFAWTLLLCDAPAFGFGIGSSLPPAQRVAAPNGAWVSFATRHQRGHPERIGKRQWKRVASRLPLQRPRQRQFRGDALCGGLGVGVGVGAALPGAHA